MRRFILLLTLLCLSSVTALEVSAARKNILKIYNWSDYMDESLLDEFEVWYQEQTGESIRIIYQTFDQNEVAVAKIERAKADYDLVCPSEYIIERLLAADMLLPIEKDFGSTPNYLGNIAPYFTEQFDLLGTPERRTSDYAIPFMWGTVGLLYNERTVSEEEVESWSIVWDKKFRNRVFLKDAVRDVYSVVQVYLNADKIADGSATVAEVVNDYSDESISRAAQKLLEARDNIAGWESDFGKEMMTKEKADISLSWSGDAVWAIEEGADVGVSLNYAVPEEGSVIWFDGWVIPKYARNVKAASYFINFMCRPDNALRNMDAIGYIPAVATLEILEEVIDESLDTYSDLSYMFGPEATSVQVDPIQYPDLSIVERCSMIRDFGDRAEDMMIMWAMVKGDNLSGGILAVIIVTALLILGFYGYKRYSEYRMRRYRQLRRR